MKVFFSSILIVFALLGCSKTTVLPSPEINTPPIEQDTVNASAFSVSNVFGDNMVIQRDKPFSIWGRTSAGRTVTVKTSWSGSIFTTVAQTDGTWKITLPATGAINVPQTIVSSVNGIKPDTLSNVLIGDVWICSGQSNMDMPVDSVSPWFGYEGVINYQAEIASANFPEIRLTNVDDWFSTQPQENIRTAAKWQMCNPQTVKNHSAVSYFFGRMLYTRLKVPVGLIVSSVGGTDCESWTDKETLQADPTLNSFYNGKNRSSQLYNGMIYPLRNMAVKGFIWYQGENNRHNIPASNYTLLTSSMIQGWRKAFNQPELPFYYVQVAPYAEDFFTSNPWGGDPVLYDYSIFREAQEKIRHVTPNTGMAFTTDVGEAFRIHPKDKRPVGERLAYIALNQTYSQSDVVWNGPRYASHTINGNIISISFVPGTAQGLTTKDNKPLAQLFFVAGTDKIFRKGNATISGDKVLVSIPAGTPLPVQAIRYAFTNIGITNLQNSAGLPAEMFRTDNWE
ncbi:sialate O-acetylesterase [Mucilaginibacter limnophilus]|uniref:Sialate O-acetylesterase n=1 Tax=Mucilaginibacter limnophilus TaxID=1932778 RepID=A0A437MRT7_9SPHI|nr:sialate O-acetylesterase [Mucilaginibacter limnophilus]RVU00345.1 sialate O-acetylesterase [Mucilaginibacter limnophilus]